MRREFGGGSSQGCIESMRSLCKCGEIDLYDYECKCVLPVPLEPPNGRHAGLAADMMQIYYQDF